MKVITIPNGRKVTLGQYVAAWKQLKTLPPSEPVKGWNWFSETAGEVLWDISQGVQDRINTRGHIKTDYPAPNQFRIKRKLLATVGCECRWCGSSLPEYQPKHSRFCDQQCRQSYNQ